MKLRAIMAGKRIFGGEFKNLEKRGDFTFQRYNNDYSSSSEENKYKLTIENELDKENEKRNIFDLILEKILKNPKDRYLLSRAKVVHIDENNENEDINNQIGDNENLIGEKPCLGEDNSSTDLKKKVLPKSGKLPLLFGNNKKNKNKKKKTQNPNSEYKKPSLGKEIDKISSTNSVPNIKNRGSKTIKTVDNLKDEFGQNFGILGIPELEDDLGSDISDYENESIKSSTVTFRTYKELIEEQLKAMALCHDAFVDSSSKSYKFYHSTSPDEIAILNGIRDIGVEFMGDEQGDIRKVEFFKKSIQFHQKIVKKLLFYFLGFQFYKSKKVPEPYN